MHFNETIDARISTCTQTVRDLSDVATETKKALALLEDNQKQAQDQLVVEERSLEALEAIQINLTKRKGVLAPAKDDKDSSDQSEQLATVIAEMERNQQERDDQHAAVEHHKLVLGRISSELSETQQKLARGRSDILDVFSEFFELYNILDAQTRMKLETKARENNSSSDIPTPQAVGYVEFYSTAGDKLSDDSGLRDIKSFRINSNEFEARVRDLMDHVSAKRIAEEMDIATYTSRLKSFLERASDRALQIARRIKKDLIPELKDQKLAEGPLLEAFPDMIDSVRSVLLPNQLEGVLENQRDASANFHMSIANAELICANFVRRLELFSTHTCGSGWYRYITEVAADVSRVIERASFIGFWPFVAAVLSTVCVKLAFGTALPVLLAEHKIGLLLATFLTSYALSLFFGIGYRARRMRMVKTRLNKEISELLLYVSHSPWNRVMRFFRWKRQFKFFEFINLPMDFVKEPPSFEKGESPRENGLKLSRFSVLSLNLSMIALFGLVTALLVGSFRGNQQHAFWGQDQSGRHCLLANGALVHTSRDAFYFVPMAKIPDSDTWQDWHYQLLPELYSQPLPQALVHSIRSRQVDSQQETRLGSSDRCDTFGPRPASEEMKADIRKIKALAVDARRLARHFIVKAESLEIGVSSEIKNLATIYAHHSGELTKSVELLTTKVSAMSDMSGESKIELVGIRTALEGFDPNFSPEISVLVEAQRQTPSHNTTEVFWNFFHYQGDQVVVGRQNSLLLPLFPPPGLETENDVQKVFKGAQDRLVLVNAPHNAGESSQHYVQHMTNVLVRVLEQSPDMRLSLNVEGFASDTWRAVSIPSIQNDLNHALAEGRRVAVIKAIKNGLEGYDARFDLIGSYETEPQCLANWEPNPVWDYVAARRFKTHGEMKEARSKWVAVNEPKGKTIAEFMHRSVLIEILPGGKGCVEGDQATQQAAIDTE